MKKVHVLKNHSKIIKETVKITPGPAEQSSFDESDPITKFDLEFMFSANYECTITVYLCATECRNALTNPLL